MIMLISFYLLAGLLISGGISIDGDGYHTAEVWLPGDRSCQLPRLPVPGRRKHTQSSYTACGGYDLDTVATRTSCDTFDGEWEQSHSMMVPYGRWDHVSWQSPAGTLLMGGNGYLSGNTTELLSTTADTTTASFSLPYDT